jgi:hypothetical protein
MPHAKPAAILGVAALILSGCGSAVKPPQGRGKVDDPRTYGSTNHLKCLLQHHLPAQEVGATGVQIGSLPTGPTVTFLPTPGAAQSQQILGNAQGAEVIGAALLYPHGGSDGQLTLIEGCLGNGVNG